jgi:hypothetical protein
MGETQLIEDANLHLSHRAGVLHQQDFDSGVNWHNFDLLMGGALNWRHHLFWEPERIWHPWYLLGPRHVNNTRGDTRDFVPEYSRPA